MGVDKSERNKLIFKQIGIYFIIPVAISLITCGITLYEFYKKYYNEVSNYIGNSIFKANIAISITMIILVFASYFTITYFSFKRNVES